MNRGENSISFATDRVNVTKYKVVFVGDQGVGKSSIINSFIKNDFDSTHNPTVGIDFVSKNLNIKGKTVRLQLWDTAGQERFRSLIPSYLKDCNAAFIVYDVTSQPSFQAVNKWLDFVKESRGNDTLIYLLGNKTDLEPERTVPIDRAQQLAKGQGIPFREVSAKTGTNLNQVFRDLCSRLMNVQIQQFDINQSLVKGLSVPGKEGTNQLKQSKVNNSIVPKNQRTVLKNTLTTRPQQVRSNCC